MVYLKDINPKNSSQPHTDLPTPVFPPQDPVVSHANDSSDDDDDDETRTMSETMYFSAAESSAVNTNGGLSSLKKASIESIIALASQLWHSLSSSSSPSSVTPGEDGKQKSGNLPQETVMHLISYIEENKKTAMYSLLGVDKKWHAAAIKKYWKHTIVNDNFKWLRFVDTCLRAPLQKPVSMHNYASFIRTLKLSNLSCLITAENWMKLISSCRLLEDLVVDSVSIQPFPEFEMDFVVSKSAPTSPAIKRRFSNTASARYVSTQSMASTSHILRRWSSASNVKNSATTTTYNKQEIRLQNLKSLKISWSPDLSIESLTVLVRNAPNLESVSLAGIHTLTERDICNIVKALPLLTKLHLGDLRSTRAPFSSSRGVGVFRGSELALTLAEHSTNLTSLELHGLMNLQPIAFAALLTVPQPPPPPLETIFSESESESEQPPVQTNQHDNNSNSRRQMRLSHIGLHSSTGNIDTPIFLETLTSPLVISHITSFSISEAHTLTDSSFIIIIQAMSKTLQHLELGPSLNLSDFGVLAIGQFCCANLVSLTCVGLTKCRDVANFVGHRFGRLETLVLRDMKELRAVRPLVSMARKKSAWRELVETVVTPEQEDDVKCNNFEESGTDDDDDYEFVDSLEDFDVVEFGGQVTQEMILNETIAAQTGLVIYEVNEPALIGCVRLRRIEFMGCNSLGDRTVVQIVSAMNRGLKKAVVSFSMVGDEARLGRRFNVSEDDQAVAKLISKINLIHTNVVTHFRLALQLRFENESKTMHRLATSAYKVSSLRTLNLTTTKRSVSQWAKVPQGPPDPILGVSEAFRADASPKKINLGVGAYRDDNNKPYVLSCVKQAEQRIASANNDKEYLGITGLAAYNALAAQLAYGEDSPALTQARLVTSQSLSGTGALRIGGEFLSRWYTGNGGKKIYLPTPSWGNHANIFRDSKLEVGAYRYYDKNTIALDFAGLKEDLTSIPDESLVLLHACAHNPTGVDPTESQWRELSDLFKRKKHVAFFDMAYQGFASGSPAKDAFAVRLFVAEGHNILLAQSFAKNLGLYGERVGLFSIVVADKDEAKRVDSQIKILVRPMYSNPPLSGPRIVKEVLGSPELKEEW
ncbi:aspartate transaminase aat1 [Physocladia obscura]|uniref:Aspartate aminotransferase n=1 Tax=Physocladia obscura TaxID=109957 RepID=A0AAD5SXY5_9FUNG|nr:aspartate transaminase aat1 [Physocladia obscura]